MARPVKWTLYDGLNVAVWLGLVLLLWIPGPGTVAVTHIDYLKESYGILTYYNFKICKGTVITQGFQVLNLIGTIALTVAISAAGLHDLKRKRN